MEFFIIKFKKDIKKYSKVVHLTFFGNKSTKIKHWWRKSMKFILIFPPQAVGIVTDEIIRNYIANQFTEGEDGIFKIEE